MKIKKMLYNYIVQNTTGSLAVIIVIVNYLSAVLIRRLAKYYMYNQF